VSEQIGFMAEILNHCPGHMLLAPIDSMALMLASELLTSNQLLVFERQLMDAQTSNETKSDGTQEIETLDQPAFNARQRLHQNIQRLQSLDTQLSWDQVRQAELLTTIELVGFKIRHLARQIQESERLGGEDVSS
jgi:hypothetical protein